MPYNIEYFVKLPCASWLFPLPTNIIVFKVKYWISMDTSQCNIVYISKLFGDNSIYGKHIDQSEQQAKLAVTKK